MRKAWAFLSSITKKKMKLLITGEDGYVHLEQLWRGDVTVRSSPSAKIAVETVVSSLDGIWHSDHCNWVVASEKSLALFEKLYQLSVLNTNLQKLKE